MPTAPYKHRLAHASGRCSRSERAFRCVGSRGIPERVLLPFARAKGSPRRIGVLTKASKNFATPIGDMGLSHRTGRGARVRAQYLPRLFAYAELLEYLVDGFGGGTATGEGKKGVG